MISIIIPTLNEEKHLPLLLDSIENQGLYNYEIIVSDAGSSDRTLEIAKKRNCKIVKGGLPGKGRNEGAKKARGNLFFFLDADVFLKEGFILKALEEFDKRNLDIASFKIIPEKGFFSVFLFNLFYNYPMIILEKILPHSAMGIIVKKEVFSKIGGFNEDVLLGEDHDFGRRAAKISKYGIIKSSVLITSLRRLEKDGWVKTSLRYFFCELHMIFIGPVKKDIFKYRFNHYFEEKEK
ncbi:MAG: glycosyltransferase [Candidatus Paceibacterota bacterium]